MIEHITRLIVEICGGEAGAIDDQTLELPACEPVRCAWRAPQGDRHAVSAAQCAEVFTRLGFGFSQQPRVRVSRELALRLAIEEDLIEELIRVIGYDKLPDTPPLARDPCLAAERSAARLPCATCWRRGLPGNHQLQLRRDALGA